jgi:hypothetical protein
MAYSFDPQLSVQAGRRIFSAVFAEKVQGLTCTLSLQAPDFLKFR